MGVVKSTIGEIKGELKIGKVIAFVVMLIVAGFVLNFLSKKSAAIANINPLPVK